MIKGRLVNNESQSAHSCYTTRSGDEHKVVFQEHLLLLKDLRNCVAAESWQAAGNVYHWFTLFDSSYNLMYVPASSVYIENTNSAGL